MAKAISGTGPLSGSPTQAFSLRAVWTLRLALGITVLLGTIIFLIGTSWDIQWHSYIGRDRTLTAPHLMMLGGVTLSGLAALIAILIETLWARRSTTIAQYSTRFSDAFSGSLGAYIAGFAALDAAIAFPLDSYWHALYGIDVAIWAPFHVMFAVGMAIAALGAAYMLVSAAHLAASGNAHGTKRAAYAGAIIAFASMMSIFTLLLFDALRTGRYLYLGFMTINVFPLLAGLLLACTFVAVAYAVPWRWVATSVVGVYLFFALLMQVFVPPATDYWLTIEQLTYRRAHPAYSIVALEWFLAPIVAAILIDVCVLLAKRRGWSHRKSTTILAMVAFVGTVPMPIISPLYGFLLFQKVGIVGFVVSFLVGLLAAFLGTWFGRNMGEAMSSLER